MYQQGAGESRGAGAWYHLMLHAPPRATCAASSGQIPACNSPGMSLKAATQPPLLLYACQLAAIIQF